MMHWYLDLVVFLVSSGTVSGDGVANCPCYNEADLSQFMSGGTLYYTPVAGGTTYAYPNDYGQSVCKAHDQGLPPFCNGASPPSFCASKFCYVKPTDCSGVALSRSVFFNQQNQLYYSYQTCGFTNTYESWMAGGDNGMSSLSVDVTTNLATARDQVQAIWTASGSGSCTGPDDLCQQRTDQHWVWKRAVDFQMGGAWLNEKSPASHARASCLFDGSDDTFLKIGTKEGDADGSRYGMIYMATQEGGNYMQWPNMEWCPAADYDPRLRPWYAGGATSAKDVVIVVDVSGSMQTVGRWRLAKAAVLSILRTVTFADFVGIILFNSKVSNVYSDMLVPGTEDNVAKMTQWVNSLSDSSWAQGGTNFRDALGKTFQILQSSIKASQTSTCQKVILFMTDGEDPQFSDFGGIHQQADEVGAIIMTYALGSQAETVVTKRLACENLGVFYPVDDGADLASIMSRYYEYFANAQHICSSSAIKFTDTASGTLLYSGCLPIYKEGTGSELLGVTCMDYTVIADIADLQKQPGWDEFICRISDDAKKCRSLEHTECSRQKFRQDIDARSVCDVAEKGLNACECIDPTCEDNSAFMDEQGYFCDAWVGDKCEEAGTQWGFSSQGVQSILAQCKKSCGKCTYSASNCNIARNCPEPQVSTPCRACSGKVTGSNIDGNKHCCPGDTSCFEAAASAAEASVDADAGAIIGIVVAVVVAVFVCLGIGFCFLRSMSSKKRAVSPPAAAPAPAVAPSVVVAPAAPAPAPAAVVTATVVSPAPVASAEVVARAGKDLPPQPVPAHWTNQSVSTKFSQLLPQEDLVPMLQALIDTTYKQVKTRDRGDAKMPTRLEVVSVQRNEDQRLWQHFMEAKAAIREQRPHRCTPLQKLNGGDAVTMKHLQEKRSPLTQGLDVGVNEVLLWHGTSPTGMQAIVKQGFKLSLAGSSTGTMYGNGAYFAECSSKSDEYGRDDKEGIFAGLNCLLLCRVILGEPMPIQVAGESVHETINVAMKANVWNSVMGDRQASVNTYREFIVYKEDQIYPEYAIIYKRKFD